MISEEGRQALGLNRLLSAAKRVDDRDFSAYSAWGRSSVGRAPQWHWGVISSILFGSTKIWLQHFAGAFLMSLNEGRVGGGGGDKLSAVYGDGSLAHGNQVTRCECTCVDVRWRGGVAAFIKIIDGKDFEFSVSAHHDGFAV